VGRGVDERELEALVAEHVAGHDDRQHQQHDDRREVTRMGLDRAHHEPLSTPAMAWPTELAAPERGPPAPDPDPDPPEPDPPDALGALSLSPDAPAICVSALIAFCPTPCQRALAAAEDSPAFVCWMGPLAGVERSVIGFWDSHGTDSSYGGRLPPGGTCGWTASSLLSA